MIVIFVKMCVEELEIMKVIVDLLEEFGIVYWVVVSEVFWFKGVYRSLIVSCIEIS